jgi:hypothetical protein
VESDLPEDLKNEAASRFQAAIDSRMAIGDAIEKVQAEVLTKCNEVFKGKRYKGFIKFDYETNTISIQVSFQGKLLGYLQLHVKVLDIHTT